AHQAGGYGDAEQQAHDESPFAKVPSRISDRRSTRGQPWGASQRGKAVDGRGRVAQVPATKKPRRSGALSWCRQLSAGAAIEPLAVALAEVLLAQADLLRGDFDQFVVLDEVQCLLQRVLDRRGQL